MLVNQFLERSAQATPDKVALVCAGTRLTFAEINRAANSLASGLVELGLQRQHRVAIYLENSAEWVVSLFAILKASGVFVPVNPQMKARKLGYVLNDCQARVLITDRKHLSQALELSASCPALTSVVVTDGSALTSGRPHVASYADILRGYPPTSPIPRNIDVDLASLIYTSGSTGQPKGTMLTHLNMVSAANSITQYLENTPDDIILDCLPLHFDYGLYQVLMALKFGGTVVLEKSFTYPYQVIELIAREKVTGLPLVPAMVAILLQLKELSHRDFASVRYITNTAQALPVAHILRLREMLPHVTLYSMYGLTECKRVAYLPPEELDRRPSSVGKPMPNMEGWLVDADGNRIAEPGAVGELVVRGANVMKGYWNLPEETARRLKPGPYPNEVVLYTNDLFKMDEEGFLYFVSRKDDIIKTAGEMVSPKEVEDVLHELDGVAEAAVIGVPDDTLGRAVKAFIVPGGSVQLSVRDILLRCRERLENYMVPRHVEFCTDLPKTATGKVDKRALR